MDQQKIVLTISILKKAQRAAEDLYIDYDEVEDFMDAALPFNEDQLDALWGTASMTEELMHDILSACSSDRWYEDAYGAVCARYPELSAKCEKQLAQEVAQSMRIPFPTQEETQE